LWSKTGQGLHLCPTYDTGYILVPFIRRSQCPLVSSHRHMSGSAMWQLAVLMCLAATAQAGPAKPPQKPVQYVTDSALRAFSEDLWASDVNRAINNDVQINRNGEKLFQYVNPRVLEGETFRPFVALLDNYEAEIGIDEADCPSCVQEENAFLDAIMRTSVMQKAWSFLRDNGLASSSESGFKEELRQYWFQLYSRSQGLALDSSGFEHVFVGEVRGSSVTGFHGWVQYYLEEQKNEAVYEEFQNDCDPMAIKLALTWKGRFKPITSFFYRVSPEFELALYTVCFQARQTGPCYVSLDGYDATVTTFSMSNVSPRTIGTAYNRC